MTQEDLVLALAWGISVFAAYSIGKTVTFIQAARLIRKSRESQQ